MGLKGTHISKIKAVYDKPTANLILNGKAESIYSKISNKHGAPHSPLLLSIVLEVLDTTRKEKINNRNPNWKEEVIFADSMILYIANAKETIRKFSKVAGYKVNTQKSLAFLYTNNENSER